ncbi:hypothetical protein C8R44DRAFT_891855 [Mycena epipterygia]|nr:hypothetical protein C8R44DRAFT_891855 [Mycena epipterygia]
MRAADTALKSFPPPAAACPGNTRLAPDIVQMPPTVACPRIHYTLMFPLGLGVHISAFQRILARADTCVSVLHYVPCASGANAALQILDAVPVPVRALIRSPGSNFQIHPRPPPRSPPRTRTQASATERRSPPDTYVLRMPPNVPQLVDTQGD